MTVPVTLSQAEITDILIYYIVPVEKMAQYCLKYEIDPTKMTQLYGENGGPGSMYHGRR